MFQGFFKSQDKVEEKIATPIADAQPDEKIVQIMISVDRKDSRAEIKIINAYCKQYRATLKEMRESSLFSMAVCDVPQSEAREFKTRVQGHLETHRERAQEKDVSWVQIFLN